MAYTGSDYFLQVKLSNTPNVNSKVRDYDIDAAMLTKGALLTSNGPTNGLASFTTVIPGSTNQVLAMGSTGLPEWTSASAAAGVNDGAIQVKVGSAAATTLATVNQAGSTTLTIAAGTTAGYLTIAGNPIQVPGTGILADSAMTSVTNLENKLVTDGFAKTGDIKNGALQIKLNSTTATNLFTANQSASATLSFASGSTNGAIAVNGTDVAVAGLKSAAFAETTAFDAAGAAATAEQNAKAYTDNQIADLGADLMNFVGAGATLPATSSSAKGDVYVINSGNDAGKEYIFDGSNWVELGSVTEVDLNNYVAKSEVVPSVTSGVALATVGGKTIYAPAAAAQQQADWATTTTTSVTYIKNKPDLSIYAEAANLDNYVTKDSVVPGVTSGISLGTVGGTTIYMPSAASLSSTLGLKALAFKDNVSVPASTFVTDITATANNQAVVGVGATGASKISAFNGGAAAFTVENGVLSLDYTAATLTYGNATTSTLATINVNNYSATKNSAMTLS